MYRPEEELRAIMDLLAEWRSKTGTGDVNIFILASGHGRAYNWDNNKSTYEVGGYFGPQRMDPDGWSRQKVQTKNNLTILSIRDGH